MCNVVPGAGMPFVVINSLCGCLCAYGLAGLRFQMRAVLLNLCITALQSMISIQLQVTPPQTRSPVYCPLTAADPWCRCSVHGSKQGTLCAGLLRVKAAVRTGTSGDDGLGLG